MACYEWNNKSWMGSAPSSAELVKTVCGKQECVPCAHSSPQVAAAADPTPDAPIPTLDLIANIKQLQTLEADIYSNMQDLNHANPSGVSVQKELLARAGDVNNTKLQLFKLINQRYQDAEDNLAHDRMALDAERRILEIAEAQLAQARANIENQRDYRTTQERIAEIDEYAFDSATAENKIVFTVFLGLVALAVELFIVNVLPGILASRSPGNSWQPSDFFKTMMSGLMVITVVITVAYATKQTYDTMGRSNRVYSEFVFGGLYGHPSGSGAPGETVWEHDQKFFEKMEKGATDTATHIGSQADSALKTMSHAAQSGLQGVEHDTLSAGGMAAQGISKAVGAHLPQAAIADPAQSSGSLAQTEQSPIEGAPPLGKQSAMVETFASF